MCCLQVRTNPIAMNHRLTFLISLISLTLAAVGCDGGRERPPSTHVRVLHAAPSFDSITFLRVESIAAGDLQYRGGASFVFDEDVYTFNVEITPPEAQMRERVYSFTQSVRSDQDYFFVLTEIGGALEALVLASPARASGADDALLMAVHAGPAVPAADLYVAPLGTAPSATQPWGRLGFTDALEPRNFAPGQYEITLTAPGAPEDVLLRTTSVELAAGESSLLAILDMGGEGLAPVGIALLRQSVEVRVDRNVQSAMRLINAAADRGPRDVFLDDDFDAPVLADVPFGSASAYEVVARGQHDVKVTPAGTSGVLEVDANVATIGGRVHTLFVAGEPGELDNVFLLDDRRSLMDRGRIRFYNGASVAGNLDFVLVPPGGDVSTVLPRTSLAPAGVSVYHPIVPGDYGLVLREANTTTVVAGPVSVSIEGGGVYGMLAVDGDAETSAQIVLLDDFVE
jgi:hypothetical protein